MSISGDLTHYLEWWWDHLIVRLTWAFQIEYSIVLVMVDQLRHWMWLNSQFHWWNNTFHCYGDDVLPLRWIRVNFSIWDSTFHCFSDSTTYFFVWWQWINLSIWDGLWWCMNLSVWYDIFHCCHNGKSTFQFWSKLYKFENVVISAKSSFLFIYYLVPSPQDILIESTILCNHIANKHHVTYNRR